MQRFMNNDIIEEKQPLSPDSPGSLPVDELGDDLLLQALAQGAVWAMEPLYYRYTRLLYSLAYHIVGDHHVAEDLVQDAFLAVWLRAPTYCPESGGVRCWLISIMHHRAIDYVRRIHRVCRSALNEVRWEDAERDEHPVGIADVWPEAWHSVLCIQVREALSQLPAEQRLVVELSYFEGWTHTQIAEKCQLPLGTVKARIRLALTHLKQILGRMGIREL